MAVVLTPKQEQQIRDFRMNGAGYRAIGVVMGLERDTVRNYCKSHGLTAESKGQEINLVEQIQTGAACPNCGGSVVQPKCGRHKKFCCDACRRKWWSAHQDALHRSPSAFHTVTCTYCGKEFTVYANPNRLYCSHACFIRDRFWRAEEGREPYEKRKPDEQKTT